MKALLVFGSTLLSTSILVSQASAADLDVKAFAPPPAYADWSGISAFGTVGYSWISGNTNFNGTDNIPGGTGQQITFARTIGLPLGFDFNDGNVSGGGGIAIDKQLGPYIFGAFTSWTFVGAQASAGASAPFDNVGDLLTLRTQTALQQYGTTQAEFGYQPVKTVPLAGFLTAGVAYGNASHTDTVMASGPFINAVGGPFMTQFNTTKTLFGPVVGAKLEYMITQQWIAGLKYEHIFWGSFDADVPLLNGGIAQSHTNLAMDTIGFEIKYKLPIF